MTSLHKLYQQTINPDATLHDIQALIEQHKLTHDVLSSAFGDILNLNPVARKLQEITGLSSISKTSIQDHQELIKTTFASLYKTRNPKEAERLGIVYTPIEIIRFMIESTDYLLQKHFNKSLADNNVTILDPATGTGSFITELINYLPDDCLEYKYQHGIFCNEIAILPHYVANLNIEHAYYQKTGEYVEYQDLCLMDTLDDDGNDTYDVIIGNPPYRANQKNANDNKQNRKYPAVDKRIKETYIKHSTAQKTKCYDMYVRFIRWASDRLNDNGILAFVTNWSFIDGKSFDGFRKAVAEEFSDTYVIDLGGSQRNTGLSGTKHNVFDIRIGVAILFMVKQENHTSNQIYYVCRPERESASEKLRFLKTCNLEDLKQIQPDKNHNWLDITNNDWDDLLPVGTKETKAGKANDAIFGLYSMGIGTNRDEWAYDFSVETSRKKAKFFCAFYTQEQERWNCSDQQVNACNFVDRTIKWTREVENYMLRDFKLSFNSNRLTISHYRPFVKYILYYDHVFIHRLGQQPNIFTIGRKGTNLVICISSPCSYESFMCLVSDKVPDSHLTGDSQCFPLCRYENGKRIDNITDYALNQFQEHYNDQTITRLNIFHYVYAVLHNPNYREKYKINLTRELPRIPFYVDFKQWLTWGQRLMDLHLDYEIETPYSLERIDKQVDIPKAKLKADKENGIIILDTVTMLTGVPPEAWEYKLGHRSALEWVLNQYRERKPRDKTIRERFDTYRFADYKEHVIDLLCRVCTVSVETVKVVREMRAVKHVSHK